jgi:predicted transcriptional regulator
MPTPTLCCTPRRLQVDTNLQTPYLWGMEVHLNPDIQAKLSRIATARGSDAELLAREAIEHFVDYDDWFIREVETGLAQIESGAVLSHQEVGTRMERLLIEKQHRA